MNHLLAHLVETGARKTTPREKITDWIAKRKGIFSAEDLLRSVRSLDKVSLYRTLYLLESEDLIHPAGTDGDRILYEKHDHENHHHHVRCVECNKSACVPCALPEKRVKGFTQIHHTVVYEGFCKDCA